MVSGGAVVLVVGLDSVNEGQVIRLLSQLREQFRHPTSRGTVPGKFEGASHADVRKGESPLQFALDRGLTRERLSVEVSQLGFVLERIHLGDAALHEKENAVLRLAWEMLWSGIQRVAAFGRSSEQVVAEQPHQAQSADSIPCTR